MFTEEEFLPISLLQHLLFCPRRAALVHIEGIWSDNIFTALGQNICAISWTASRRTNSSRRVCRRYLAIGGGSPLPEIAAAIAEGLEERLGQEGSPTPVRVGMSYWHPFIADRSPSSWSSAATASSPCRCRRSSPRPPPARTATRSRPSSPSTGTSRSSRRPLLSSSEEFVDFFAGSAAVGDRRSAAQRGRHRRCSRRTAFPRPTWSRTTRTCGS